MRLSSDAFEHGQEIPKKFSCDGEDVSPPLAWEDPPEGTRAFALICDDPDAPIKTFTHWLVYDLPADRRALPQSLTKSETVLGGGTQGKNSFGRLGYGGPCPPTGVHRYFFKLYALSAPLGLPPGAGKDELLAAMKGRVLAETELMGTYKKVKLATFVKTALKK
jgi:Raf kinase inhibitor-like YbhB/YbcL family protein